MLLTIYEQALGIRFSFFKTILFEALDVLLIRWSGMGLRLSERRYISCVYSAANIFLAGYMRVGDIFLVVRWDLSKLLVNPLLTSLLDPLNAAGNKIPVHVAVANVITSN